MATANGNRGGGGYTSIKIVCIFGYVPRERTPFSAPNFRSGAYNFHKLPKNPFRILPFRRPSFSKFIKFQPVHHLPRPVRQRRGLAAGQSASQTRPGSSGDSHFYAQNGSSSFRSPAFACTTVSSFRSPGPISTLPRHIPTKIWDEYIPPPPRGGGDIRRRKTKEFQTKRIIMQCLCHMK